MIRGLWVVALVACGLLLSTQLLLSSNRSSVAQQRAHAHDIARQYSHVFTGFELNEGQTDGQVKFLYRGNQYTLFLTSDGVVLKPSLSGQRAESQNTSPIDSVIRMKFVRANDRVVVSGLEELPTRINYLLGSDSARWHTGLKTFAKVGYKGIYPGIDLVYYRNSSDFEYDFILHPNADSNLIRMSVTGAESVRVTGEGDLVLESGSGIVLCHRPGAYQLSGKRREAIDGRYVLLSGSTVGFKFAKYDHDKALFVDPVVTYSTYLGGLSSDAGWGVAVDSLGQAYVTGWTGSPDFPITNNAFQKSCVLCVAGHAFVSKLSADGSTLLYSTYIGGSNADRAIQIAVGGSGEAFITGTTSSSDFPVTQGAFQTSCRGNPCSGDAFISKLSSDGTTLVYSTYLGGSGSDNAYGLALGSDGSAVIVGLSNSSDFPCVPIGGAGGFISKLDPTGTTLTYSTCLGLVSSTAVAVDLSGNAYVTGSSGLGMVTTPGVLQPTFGGGSGDAFVTKLDSSGSILYSTFLGGSGSDVGYGVAVDGAGNAYIAGITNSLDFPVRNWFQATCDSCTSSSSDTFLAKVSPTGSALVYSTYLGGSEDDVARAVTLDSSGNVYLAGNTQSADFPVITPVQLANHGGSGPINGYGNDVFVSQFDPNGTLIFSSFLGGTDDDFALGLAADTSGNVYVAGYTESLDFPTTRGSLQSWYGGSACYDCIDGYYQGDAFVAKISSTTTMKGPVGTVSPAGLKFNNQRVGKSSATQYSFITNNGTAPLTITQIVKTSPAFSTSSTCPLSPQTLPVGAQCRVTTQFNPKTQGVKTGFIKVFDNGSDSPQIVSLIGNTVSSKISLTPVQLSFPTQVVRTSKVKDVSIFNASTSSLIIQNYGYTTDISVGGTCFQNLPFTLAPGTSCQVSVTFKPLQAGFRYGYAMISDSDAGSPHIIGMSGMGTFVKLSKNSLGFGSLPVGSKSSPKSVSLTNVGSTALSFSSIQITGPNAGDFNESNTCGSSLAANATCSISVTFTPVAVGLRQGILTINDSDPASPQTVKLVGSGS